MAYATAIGTVGAAAFAGWAALSARQSTDATRRLVEVETSRDEVAARDAEYRQARRVVASLYYESIVIDGRHGADFSAYVINASGDVIRRARVKVVLNGSVWGPCVIGMMEPHTTVSIMARVYTDEPVVDGDVIVRFTDVDERRWVARLNSPVAPDSEPIAEWVVEGNEFLRRVASIEERGTMDGVDRPNFDEWRQNRMHEAQARHAHE